MNTSPKFLAAMHQLHITDEELEYRQIRELEIVLGVEPQTTWEHYRSTTEAEREEYLRWLKRNAPYHWNYL
jgi:hypothetical protein